MAQRSEKVGAHMQPQAIDKHRQAERLGVVERHLVDGHADIAGHDAHEKHEGDAQRDAHDTYLAQSQTCRNDQGDNDNSLYRGMNSKERSKPVHVIYNIVYLKSSCISQQWGLLIQYVEIVFQGYAAVLVGIVLIEVDEPVYSVHGDAGGESQRFAVEQVADQHSREDVARAGEVHRYLGVGQQEIFSPLVVVSGHAVLSLNGNGGDEY